MILICEKCKKEFHRTPSKIYPNTKYCSATCRQHGRRITQYQIDAYLRHRKAGESIESAMKKVRIGKNSAINIEAGRYDQPYLSKPVAKEGFFNVDEYDVWL